MSYTNLEFLQQDEQSTFSVLLYKTLWICTDWHSFWFCFLVLTGQADECVPASVKQVELRVPRTTGLHSVWSFSDFTPYHLQSLPARLFGCQANSSPSLWMLSVCLAEIEKHKGERSYQKMTQINESLKLCLLVLCHQVLESSQLPPASAPSLRSHYWHQAESPSGFGRRLRLMINLLPQASASAWSNMEETRLTWLDRFQRPSWNKVKERRMSECRNGCCRGRHVV